MRGRLGRRASGGVLETARPGSGQAGTAAPRCPSATGYRLPGVCSPPEPTS